MSLELLITYIVGVLGGSIATNLWFYLKSASGTLLIDRSNELKDVYRIELDTIDDLSTKHRVVLKVDSNADLSSK